MTLSEWAKKHRKTYAEIAELAMCHPSQISRIANGSQWPGQCLAWELLKECPGLSWDDWLREHS